jgi:hypothetical protein
MEDQTPRTCKDCFNCRTQVILKQDNSNRYSSHRVNLPLKNKQLKELLNKKFSYSKVRCTKGLWQRVVGEGEKTYKNFYDFMRSSPKLPDVMKCLDFEEA